MDGLRDGACQGMTSVEIWRDLLGFGPTSLPGVAGSCESLAVARHSDCCPVRDVRGSCEFLLSVGLEQLVRRNLPGIARLAPQPIFLNLLWVGNPGHK